MRTGQINNLRLLGNLVADRTCPDSLLRRSYFLSVFSFLSYDHTAMAQSLFYKSTKDITQPHSYIPPPPPSWVNSPSLQVPDVFLIAPEEDNAPPWLLYDAAKDSNRDLSRTPDLDFLDVALDVLRRADRASAPVVRRESGEETEERYNMSRKGDPHSRQRPLAYDEIPWPGMQGIESEGDSVVVEVVKVRKADGMHEPGEIVRTMKKSKIFKAAASKAFRSIKNVAKGSNRKPSAQDVWPSSGSSRPSHAARLSKEEEQPQPRPSTPTMSRRSSLTLTQLFQTPSKSRSSADTSEFALSTSAFPSERAFSMAPLPHNPMPFLSRAETTQSLDIQDDNHPRMRSLSPSPSTKSSFRKRLSMLELRRVFTSLKSPESQEISSIPTMSRDGSTNSSAPSTSTLASFEIPGTPDDTYRSTQYPSLHAEKAGRRRADETHVTEPGLEGDISFEMRLESLQFDSLSFDPNAF
jgi:hypothetical protein